MKYINIVLTIMFFAVIVSCEVQNPDILVGGDGNADLSGNQYANINPSTRVNFIYQATPSLSVALNKFEASGSTIASVEVTKTLTIADVIDSDDTTVGFKSTPVTYSITGDVFTQSLAELFADVPVNGAIWVEDSLDPGDSWLLEYKINLSGNAPTSDNVLALSTTTFVPFACLSKIPTDIKYKAVTVAGAFGAFGSNAEVTIKALDSDGNYELSDLTGGFYTAFGFNLNQPGTINDLCNFISVTGAPNAQFNLVQDGVVGPGSWNASTSTLTINWYDAGNDFSDITVLTPAN